MHAFNPVIIIINLTLDSGAEGYELAVKALADASECVALYAKYSGGVLCV